MVSFEKRNMWKFMTLILGVSLVLSIIMYPMIGKASTEGTVSSVSRDLETQRTINVTGSADVMVAPDEVDITVGIETRNADFQKAKSENNDNAKKVIALTKKYGIDPKYVQSDYMRTYPSYKSERESDTSKVAYYNVQKRIVIKLKDILQFENLTSDLMENGLIQIQNIEFRSTELSKYKNEARKLAIRAARDKAKLLTSELGSDIGKPVTINEEQIGNFTWYGSGWSSSWYGYGQNTNLLSNVISNQQESSNPEQTGETISIGQIKITARIGVVFELK